MSDKDPAGFEFSPSSRLKKHGPRSSAQASDTADDTIDGTDRRSKAVISTDAPDVGHGRPAGAGNALAFHSWGKSGKAPPKPDTSG